MHYTLHEITTITNASLPNGSNDLVVKSIITDSRTSPIHPHALFVALVGERNNGHDYLQQAYANGCRFFMVSKEIDHRLFPEASIIQTPDTLIALQTLAAFHRMQMYMPVIGITGSNGKTVVKEWLYHLLNKDYKVYRSPRSYNSQIGVPLSVLGIEKKHGLAIIEAGISQSGEMQKLQYIIKPDMVVFTHLGTAHDAGFENHLQKAEEKLILAEGADCLVTPVDNVQLKEALEAFKQKQFIKIIGWGYDTPASVNITKVEKSIIGSIITFIYKSSELKFEIPFADDASIANAITCLCCLLALERLDEEHLQRFATLQPVEMRLQMLHGVNNCIIINDSYNADIESLQVALDYLERQNPRLSKTLILSDLQQSGLPANDLYNIIANLIKRHHIDKLIGIGPDMSKHIDLFDCEKECYIDTTSFITKLNISKWSEQAILIKGSRIFGFEQISKALEKKTHQTRLEINLENVAHNLHTIMAMQPPTTKVMAMVKAFGYGSGGHELAKMLQHQKVNYMAVAYADEGVELRKAGIKTPIMVMSPEPNSYRLLVDYNLEPEVYSPQELETYIKFLADNHCNTWPSVHLELDTGMHRLGFQANEIEVLYKRISELPKLKIASVFTHLAAADENEFDTFTQSQLDIFEQMANQIQETIPYPIVRHASNTAGSIRFNPNRPLDMVRLGIGLYGIDPTKNIQSKLQPVSRLVSVILQTKHIKQGDTIGYGRHTTADKDMQIGIIAIGYADGLNRLLSNRNGKLYINKQPVDIVGNVCMDMCMVDLTNIEAKAGDEIIIFETAEQLNAIANACQTIPYEILTHISQRVNRVYVFD